MQLHVGSYMQYGPTAATSTCAVDPTSSQQRARSYSSTSTNTAVGLRQQQQAGYYYYMYWQIQLDGTRSEYQQSSTPVQISQQSYMQRSTYTVQRSIDDTSISVHTSQDRTSSQLGYQYCSYLLVAVTTTVTQIPQTPDARLQDPSAVVTAVATYEALPTVARLVRQTEWYVHILRIYMSH